ncbi:DNA polymerase IV [Salinarchaeum sp. Harcht-Bsk1]|nr:DNA polymerase IV [Salinarchaeum sp. Harcht-Bsk1]
MTDRVTGAYYEDSTVQQGPTLPGVETGDDEDRIVLHVDLDCFYAACERLREPKLAGKPLVVGMGYEGGQPDGAVATASYEAREHGVESAQAISTALERLPRAADHPDGIEAESDGPDAVGYYRPVDMAYYQEIAAEIKEILHNCAETVREVSIDEAYLDVTDRTEWSVVEGYARHVKQRIDREVGLTASVGVAPTMHAAKVASDHDKPDGLVVVEPGDVEAFLAPLPIDDLHGIGPVTASTLREHGIETVADLADADREWVHEQWGDRGLELYERARGIDPRSVEPRGRPKSLSRESSLGGAEDDFDAVEQRIRTLAEAVAERARSKEALYRTIGIKVVTPPFDVNTRAQSLPGPVDDPDLVETVAIDLLEEFEDATPRKVGVRVSNLSFADADQSTLGGWDGDSTATDPDDREAVEPAEVGTDASADSSMDSPADSPMESPPESPLGSPGDSPTESTLDSSAESTLDSSAESPAASSTGSHTESPGAPSTTSFTTQSTESPDTPPTESPNTSSAGPPDESSTESPDDGQPGQSVLDRVWSDGPAERADPEPIGQPPDQTTLSEFE